MFLSSLDFCGLVELFQSFRSLWLSVTTLPSHHCDDVSAPTHLSAQPVSTSSESDSGAAVEILVPHGCIHHACLAHASARPQQPAVVDHLGLSLTYGALDSLSMRVAKFLHHSGVHSGSRVCLLVHRSVPQVIGIIAVLRAGAAYVPLDGDVITDNALVCVLEDAQPAIILISRKFLARAKDIHIPFACLEDVIYEPEYVYPSVPDHSLDDTQSSDGAYVIYTSGTTGRPKGVAVSHLNVINLLCLSPGNLGIAPGVRVAQLLNVAFDMCAWETLGCLMNGGTLYLRGPHRADWLKVLETVHVVICTPSILSQHNPCDFPNIRVVATAGEPCPQALADSWAKRVTFYNSCGPTEVTIVNTMSRHSPGTPISIGRPTPNNYVYILDDDMRPLPVGVPGVMWAGGLGVCQGYLNRPDLNCSKFLKDRFSAAGGIIYNTGDIGQWRADGNIEHLGRIDEQVKIKGFRVDLDGVAAAMRSYSGVRSACALLIGEELWGFFSPEDVASDEVQHATAQIQPYYAVPVKYRSIPKVPLTSNGKIDKFALRRMVEIECMNQ